MGLVIELSERLKIQVQCHLKCGCFFLINRNLFTIIHLNKELMEASENTCARLGALLSALSSPRPLAPGPFGPNIETSNLKPVFPAKLPISA